MLNSDVDSALFTVKKVSCFAQVSKNYNVFSNYATFDTKSGKIISSVSDNFNLITNEQLLQNVKSISGSYPTWYYSDGKNYYFYAPHKKISEDVEVWLEIINTYDGHIARQVNFMIAINGLYLFIDIPAMIDCDNDNIQWSCTPTFIEKFIKTLEELKCSSLYETKGVPQKYRALIRETYTTEFDRLKSYLPTIVNWSASSFLEARKYSIKIFNHTIA